MVNEKNINLVEDLIKEFKTYNDLDGIDNLKPYIEAIENMLNRNKELEEKNKKLNQLKEKHNVRINDLCALVDNFAYNSIPVSLVEEKIEELNKLLEEDLQDERKVNSNRFIIICQCKNCLQELLEKRE